MADPNAQMATQMIQWFFQASGLILDVTQTGSDVFTKALSPLDNDPYIQQLNQSIKNGECNGTMLVKQPGEDAKAFEERVKGLKDQIAEAGAFCHVLKTSQGYMFITLKDEADKLKGIIQADNQRESSSVSNQAMSKYSDGSVKEIKTHDEYAAYMFKARCEANNIPVKIDAVTEFGTNQMVYKVRFAAKDLDKINAIKRNVAIDMTDPAKEIRKAQIDFELKTSLNNINNTLNLENAGNYIVGKNGSAIKVNTNNVVFINGDKSETVYLGTNPQSMQLFNDKVLSTMAKMGVTTQLTPEQYTQYMNAENKRDYILSVERENGRPELSDAEKEILCKCEKQRARVEAKLLQSHPEEVAVDLNDYNNEESILMFKTNEKIDYEVSHDISESEQIDAAFLDDARAYNDGLVPEDLEVPIDVDELADQIMDAEEIDVESINDQSFEPIDQREV